MFGDYSKLVLQDFKEKRANKQVPLGLIHLSLAQLRRDCIQISTKRPYERKKDEVGLNGFFGIGYDRAAVLEAINNCPIERFKPLEYFLKGKTKEPNERVIELLAWMIDFEKRPFELGKTYEKQEDIQENPRGNTENSEDYKMHMPVVDNYQEKILKEPGIKDEMQIVGTQICETSEIDLQLGHPSAVSKNVPDVTSPNVTSPVKINFKKIIWPVAFTILLTAIFFLYRREGCMYWAGDHFERISCNEIVNGKLVLPADAIRIRDFKKITQPDTLKKSDINRVFYSKLDGEFEYFTSGGFHPVYLTKSLKPLSEYIYERYIVPLKLQLNSTANANDSLIVDKKALVK